MHNIEINIDTNPSEENDAIIREGLFAYNHKVINSTPKHFSIYARLANKIVGGCLLYHHADALYVEKLWLDENIRKQNLGSRILDIIDKEAKARNCHKIFLHTYAFQAKEFYEKNGFKLIGVIADYLLGYDKLYLRKDI